MQAPVLPLRIYHINTATKTNAQYSSPSLQPTFTSSKPHPTHASHPQLISRPHHALLIGPNASPKNHPDSHPSRPPTFVCGPRPSPRARPGHVGMPRTGGVTSPTATRRYCAFGLRIATVGGRRGAVLGTGGEGEKSWRGEPRGRREGRSKRRACYFGEVGGSPISSPARICRQPPSRGDVLMRNGTWVGRGTGHVAVPG
ncbi:hypothetical protein PSPO01_03966 [Paraphaeosphaeria sporulosa]